MCWKARGDEAVGLGVKGHTWTQCGGSGATGRKDGRCFWISGPGEWEASASWDFRARDLSGHFSEDPRVREEGLTRG